MKARRLLFAVLMLGMCAATAHAGIFVGASAGQSGIADQDSSLSTDYSESDTSTKVFGGFRVMKFFAIEGSYVDLGSPSGDAGGGVDAKVSASGWDAMAVGLLPLGKHFEIFAKAGLIYWSTDVKLSGAATGSDSNSGTDGMFGAGFAIVFGKHIAARLEYEKFNVSDIDTVDLTSAGIDFRF
jgi:OOP family OmpA-OmpF porin